MEKVKSKTTFEFLGKVRDNVYAEKLASALACTGCILNTLGSIGIPVVGALGGALRIGGIVLNPPTKLADLTKQSDDIKKKLDDATEDIQKNLKSELQIVQDLMKETLQDNIQTSFTNISQDLKKINENLETTMDLVHKSYEIILDQRYKQGIENIEAAHTNLLMGSHNLNQTLPLLENFMFELQTTAVSNFKPTKVQQYLKEILKVQGMDMAKIIFNYIIIVKAKYLQIVSIFYSHFNDTVRIEKEFQSFNSEFEELEIVHLKLFGEKYDPENVPKVPPETHNEQIEKNGASDDETVPSAPPLTNEFEMNQIHKEGEFIFKFKLGTVSNHDYRHTF